MSKEYILITEPARYASQALSIYQSLGEVVALENASNIDTYLKKATVLVVRLGINLSAKLLKSAPHLKFIVSPATGLNHIDLDFCKDNAIEVLSLKNEKEFLQTVTATAELTIGLILVLVRRLIAAHLDTVKGANWERDKFCGRELTSLSLGILGFGRIGQMVARFSKTLGMKVYAYDPYVHKSSYQARGVKKVRLSELYALSDIISVHVDYPPKYKCMIGTKQFNQMKRGSFFVNTSRGELIDEKALVQALKTGKLAGAAVDVLQNEYNQKLLFKSPLIKYARANNNLVITPHLGGCTLDSMQKTEIFMAKKLQEKILKKRSPCLL